MNLYYMYEVIYYLGVGLGNFSLYVTIGLPLLHLLLFFFFLLFSYLYYNYRSPLCYYCLTFLTGSVNVALDQ